MNPARGSEPPSRLTKVESGSRALLPKVHQTLQTRRHDCDRGSYAEFEIGLGNPLKSLIFAVQTVANSD